MRRESHGLRRLLRDHADFVFAEAADEAWEGSYRWWEDEAEDQLLAACQRLGEEFAEEPRFDVVLGFSQGAALAAALLALQQCGRSPLAFRGAILFAGYNAPALRAVPGLAEEAEGCICLPSLHVFGRRDLQAAPSEARALARHFRRPRLLPHPGGHRIARGGEVAQAALDLLNYLTPREFRQLPPPPARQAECQECGQTAGGFETEDPPGEWYCDDCWQRQEDAASEKDAEDCRLGLALMRRFGQQAF